MIHQGVQNIRPQQRQPPDELSLTKEEHSRHIEERLGPALRHGTKHPKLRRTRSAT